LSQPVLTKHRNKLDDDLVEALTMFNVNKHYWR